MIFLLCDAVSALKNLNALDKPLHISFAEAEIKAEHLRNPEDLITFLKRGSMWLRAHIPSSSGPVSGQRRSIYSQLQHQDSSLRATPESRCGCVLSRSVVSTSGNSVDCNLPGSPVHVILQARTLEWVAMPSSRGSAQPKDRSCISYVSCIGRQVLYR